ncbi:hypothetical protein F4813DRAFT_9406 [Daldinia decipiens]|uniref:uncharacterized protein n=1 Tax=Daldinia decipiens TaxID=326647 RepID=UPI0020C51EF1|nr:uncharacterized protein F4813DRAFT_9406 [Daldinia decipiens]KAI1662741.1 hypothetical protein F4813DRAFT_9406 [Daldinia decipiens]
MSGLEIAGLVLGALPLAIKAVQSYKSILSSMWHVQYGLICLQRDLETECIRFQNTCETLLVGIAPLAMIDRMTNNPFGDEWKRYSDELSIRLWTSKGTFETHVAEMLAATKELKEKLCIPSNDATNPTDSHSILQELKKGTSFTLNRKDYENILSRIKTGNSALEGLIAPNNDLESNRRHRSQARVTRLLRGLSLSIYNAILSALTCTCANEHSVSLELEHRRVVLVPGDIEEQVAKKFNFNIVLKSANGVGADGRNCVAHVIQDTRESWSSLAVRLVDNESDERPSSPTKISNPSQNTRRRIRLIPWMRPKSSKSNIAISSATKTRIKNIQKLPILPTTPSSPKRVINLCKAIQISNKQAVSCFGYVLHSERKFELYPSSSPSFQRKVTLRQIVDISKKGLPPFEYPDKIKAALALSISILHLYDTPWLENMVTLDDIVFFYDDCIEYSHHDSPYRPHIMKSYGSGNFPLTTQKVKSPNSRKPMNLIIFSLGVLLTQLIIGKAIKGLDVEDNMDVKSVSPKRKIGSRLTNGILENGGTRYLAVVNWCFENVHNEADLRNDNFCQEFFEAVVTQLEDCVDLLERGN